MPTFKDSEICAQAKLPLCACSSACIFCLESIRKVLRLFPVHVVSVVHANHADKGYVTHGIPAPQVKKVPIPNPI